MKDSLNERTAAGSTPSFARMQDALQYAAGELKAGRCVTVWPVDAAGYGLVAWDFETHADDVDFAPTAPLELDLPTQRGATF